MKLDKFYDNVQQAQDIQGLHVNIDRDSDSDYTMVELLPPDHKGRRIWKIYASAIAEQNWETLLAVMEERRDVAPIIHMSRVVGYFSRIENWNKSKLGELADRRLGNYRIEDANSWK